MTSIPKGIAKLLASGPVTNPKTGTRATAIANNNYIAKIVLQGKKNPQAQKLGLVRTINEFMPNGERYMTADFDVQCSLNAGWGGLRTLRGTMEQMKTTFKYLNKSVNENCNTITVLDNLEKHLFKLFPDLRNKFAQISRS